MTDAPSERKRKSNRFILLLALAAVVAVLVAWLASRDSNDGEVTGITESGAPVFEGTDPVTLGTGVTSRELPGAPDQGSPTGAQEGGGAGTITAPVDPSSTPVATDAPNSGARP